VAVSKQGPHTACYAHTIAIMHSMNATLFKAASVRRWRAEHFRRASRQWSQWRRWLAGFRGVGPAACAGEFFYPA